MIVRKRVLLGMTSVMLSFVLAFSFSVGSAFATPVTAGSIDQASLSTQATKSGWVTKSGKKYYYRNGSAVTGLQKIGKYYYYFTSKGVMKKANVSVGGAKFYIGDNGRVYGAKMSGKCYYANLKPMTKSDKYDFETYVKAKSIISKITKKSDSKKTKLWKAFKWVIGKQYAIHQNFNPREKNWTAKYARYHFYNKGGDCHSDGAAFAYLAAAIGYKADVCIDSWGTGYAPSHCWTMIGKTAYDPLFYESKGTQYWALKGDGYESNPKARFRVPQYNSKNAKKSAKVPAALLNAGSNGLKTSGGKVYYYSGGKAVKSAWKTVNGKRYYFTKSGAAATLSTKIGGTYYVFDKNGVLQNSTKSGNRVVTIGSTAYQVDKDGKAVAGWSTDKTRYFTNTGKAYSGWSADKTQYFDSTGLLLKGDWVVDGKFYAADASGTYDADRTSKLNAAAKKGAPAADLRALLGEPDEEIYSASCNFSGDDGLWQYSHFVVTTARPTTGTETVATIEAL